MLLFRSQGDGSNCEVSADGAIDMNLIPGTYMGEGENRPPPKKVYKAYPFPQNKYIKCNLKFNAFVLNQHQGSHPPSSSATQLPAAPPSAIVSAMPNRNP